MDLQMDLYLKLIQIFRYRLRTWFKNLNLNFKKIQTGLKNKKGIGSKIWSNFLDLDRIFKDLFHDHLRPN